MSAPLPDHELRVRAGAIAWKVVDGEAIVLDLAESEYIGLNPSATSLLHLLSEGCSREDAITHLCAEFLIDRERAAIDVDSFVEACRDKGWLE